MQRNTLDVVWKVLAIKVELKIGGHLNISHGNNDKVVFDQMRKLWLKVLGIFLFFRFDIFCNFEVSKNTI